MPKFKVLLRKTSCVTRWIEADSEEQVRQIIDGEDGAPDLGDAEYEYDEDHEDEEISKIIPLED